MPIIVLHTKISHTVKRLFDLIYVQTLRPLIIMCYSHKVTLVSIKFIHQVYNTHQQSMKKSIRILFEEIYLILQQNSSDLNLM
jgi:hypothetical protein